MHDEPAGHQPSSTSTPLLSTKLTVPRHRSQLIARVRLLAKLGSGLESKCTLVLAPAGYGKTILLSQWIEEIEQPAAWLSLETTENDPARFLAYLIGAICTIQDEQAEEICAAAYAYLRSNSRTTCQTILTILVNDIAASTMRFVLVLDDYHVIDHQGVHDVVAFLLEHLPEQMHLVIVGRREPPVPLARLRVASQLNSLDAADLAFTADEIAEFLHETMVLSLNDAQIEQVTLHTEGWIAGVQLAALALQKGILIAEALSGQQRHLGDYLAEEVWQRQPELIQQFLLQTSILKRLTGPLCEAVVERSTNQMSGQSLLHQIEDANLFLVSLDGSRHWYRYHHLFGDFLQSRLKSTADAVMVATLHQRAAVWYQQNGFIGEAMEHTLAAKDFELASNLIAQNGRNHLHMGEGTTLLRWLDALPLDKSKSLSSSEVELTLLRAWSLLLTGAMDTLQVCLSLLEEHRAANHGAIQGEMAALRSRLAAIKGDSQANVHYAKQALAQLPTDNRAMRGEMALNLGLALYDSFDFQAQRQAFTDAFRLSKQAGNLRAAVMAAYNLAGSYALQGKLRRSKDMGRQILEAGDTQSLPVVGFAHVGLAYVCYEQNELALAEEHVRKALQQGKRSGDFKIIQPSLAILARLHTVYEAWDDAQYWLDALEEQTTQNGVSYERVQLALQQGSTDIGEAWLAASEIGPDDIVRARKNLQDGTRTEPLLLQLNEYLQYAHVQMALGNFEHLGFIISELAALAEQKDLRYWAIHAWSLLAMIHWHQGDWTQASHALQRGLNLAGSEPFTRIFLDKGPAMTRLLHHISTQGMHIEQIDRLLNAAGQPHLKEAPHPQIQPLSQRELEILDLVAAGRSNQAIADELVVTVNTIKTHLRRIYDKLNVSSRTQAVAQARAFSLL
ncbi:MAG: LuxR C-terminal-related transcriptional regulator [Chloroflexota bacterium]